jgi:hypothetical protein
VAVTVSASPTWRVMAAQPSHPPKQGMRRQPGVAYDRQLKWKRTNHWASTSPLPLFVRVLPPTCSAHKLAGSGSRPFAVLPTWPFHSMVVGFNTSKSPASDRSALVLIICKLSTGSSSKASPQAIQWGTAARLGHLRRRDHRRLHRRL